VSEDWRREVTSIFKKNKKEDPRNYRRVDLTSVPGKLMEQLTMETTSRHFKNKKENNHL